ncbi:hypothetical protein ACO2Q3_24140 [Caulobacter sp. KR2-114]|uniref:hypothetical protein n=1 Tax=Caulobacter sp. KR2-114 TaxID=3400912 RepID=UPI003BFE1374
MRRVLVCGLGVAGATLAWWLSEFGFEVTAVERAPGPRTGGYMIDFWGLGYDVAERMGMLPALKALSYGIEELHLMRADGGRLARIGAGAVRAAMGERFFSIQRGELAAELLRQLDGRADLRFEETVKWLTAHENAVEVGFLSGAHAHFDVVIGADGLHSRVRALAMPQARESPTGLWAAAFTAKGYGHRDPGAYVSYTTVGRQVARYALRDGACAFFLVFRLGGLGAQPRAVATQKALLREAFGGEGWECPEILAALEAAKDLYFDSVSQVRAPTWSAGRVALVGDAAYCPSLLAGEGASLGMAGAYLVASSLRQARSDPWGAFRAYEARLRPLVERKQASALRIADWFAPRTRLGLLVRNGFSRLTSRPAFAQLLVGGMLASQLDLS